MGNGKNPASMEIARDDQGRGMVQSGHTATESFGSAALARTAETSTAAMEAQARAGVEARFVMAIRRPRDWMVVRQRILDECKRPAFAKVARYLKPVGKGLTGPSIRFAEVAMRCMGNIDVDTPAIYDDDTKRILRVIVLDLESNNSVKKDITITKTVERSFVPEGEQAIRVRTNSRGGRTYILPATDDDILNKENALISKAMRTGILRLLPGDILDEAMMQVIKTQNDEDARDPAAARKHVVDVYASQGITAVMLADYLGHSSDQMTPPEIADLRALGLAIRDGEATFAEALALKKKERAGGTTTEDGAKVSPLKQRVKEQASKVAPKGKADKPAGEQPPTAPERTESARASSPPEEEDDGTEEGDNEDDLSGRM